MNNILPHDLLAERAFLAAALIDASIEASSLLKPDDFYDSKNASVFEAILSIIKKQNTVDIRSVSNFMMRGGQGNGIVSYISSLVDYVSGAQLYELANIIRSLSIRRRLYFHHMAMASKCLGRSEDVDQLIYDNSVELNKIQNEAISDDWKKMSSISDEMIDKWEKQHGMGISGIPTGLIDIDRVLSGLQDTDLIVIGGRPSMGKTGFALKVARNAAEKGFPVGFRSIEMRHGRLFTRAVSDIANIDSERFRTGNLNAKHWEKVVGGVAMLHELPVFIDDRPYETIQHLQRSIRSFHRKHGHCLIIIDYLQYIKGEKSDRMDIEIGTITRGLKQVANELFIPIIILAQLNRKLEDRDDKRPRKSDLRGSGEIEQDADIVAFLYRDEVYNPKGQLSNGQSNSGYAEFIIDKNRDGQQTSIPLTWIAHRSTFENYKSSP